MCPMWPLTFLTFLTFLGIPNDLRCACCDLGSSFGRSRQRMSGDTGGISLNKLLTILALTLRLAFQTGMELEVTP